MSTKEEMIIDGGIDSGTLESFLGAFPIEELAEYIFVLDGFGIKLELLDLLKNYEIDGKLKKRAVDYYEKKAEDEKKKKFMNEIIFSIVEDDQMIQ